MPDAEIIVTREQGVLTFTLNRPKARNAMTGAMFDTFLAELPKAATDPEVRVVVVTGAGGAFCAGGDVGGIEKASAAPLADAKPLTEAEKQERFDKRVQFLRKSSAVTELLHTMPKPTIAAIPGAAAGAGFSLALSCDLKIAKTNAKLNTAFSKIGMSGDLGGSYFLTQLVGPLKARELYFFSDVLTGAQAQSLGIVNYAVSEEEYDEAVRALVKRVAALPTVAIGYMKRNLTLAENRPLGEVLDSESELMIRSMSTADHRAGIRAFVDRSTPVFTGR